MISLLSRKLAQKKEHAIVYPSNAVHISTIPLKLASDKKKEAISATAQVAQLRDKKKESFKVSEYHTQNFKKIREADKTPGLKTNVYQVVLIEEGLGNFRDRFFYTKEALQKAAALGLFEGSQAFADHPSEIEESSRPERSTRDILGYYTNVQYQENEQGQGQLVANLAVANIPSLDWANALLSKSVEYSIQFKEKDLVGLSINASGSASPIGIDDFMALPGLSESILQKLLEAKNQGITEINVVSELTEATSVDLVTKAGAGGRILKMLEMEKKMEKHESESKGMPHEPKAPKMPKAPGMGHHKQNEAHDDQAHMQPGGDADGASADHADADQDKALFAKMIKQYLGKDDADHDEMEMAKHAYDAHKEAGMEGHEAYEAAGKHLKMAMAIGKKMAQCKQAESETEAEAHESESESETMEAEKQSPPPNPHESRKKESMQVAKLAGEIAKMRESLKQYELRDYLDAKMKNSGESNTVTKKFREALGNPRSKEQIDSTWNVFIKAYKAGAEEVSDASDMLFMEKNARRESESSGMSFTDCLV